jgi:hypothetical protein
MEPSSTLIVAFCVVTLPLALVVSLLFLDFVFFTVAPKALFGKAKKASVALKGTENAEEGHGPVHRNADFQDELVKSTDGQFVSFLEPLQYIHNSRALHSALGDHVVISSFNEPTILTSLLRGHCRCGEPVAELQAGSNN